MKKTDAERLNDYVVAFEVGCLVSRGAINDGTFDGQRLSASKHALSTPNEDVVSECLRWWDDAIKSGLLVERNLSKNTISVQISDVSSSQDWTVDPDMVEIEVGAAFLQKAESCIAFMQENDINYMGKWSAFGYTLYALAEDPEDDGQDKPMIIGQDGQQYVEFTPKYQLDGCTAKIYKDGDIQVVMPFKRTNDELWCDIGNIKDLKVMLRSEAVQNSQVERPRG